MNFNNKSDFKKRYNAALLKLEQYKRLAYIPQVRKVKSEHNSNSKIGGLPFLRHESDWPICPNCNNNMQLFLQLNLKTVPKKKSDGLIQLFYCTNSKPLCESDLEAFFPFSDAVVCRKIKANGNSSIQVPKLKELFEEKIIENWEEKNDYPQHEEWNQLGIDFEIEDDIYELMDEKNEGVPLGGDKLFGWPFWVQSVEYPNDRKTNKQMELLFQLDSNFNLPYTFGDLGTGHLTISPDNTNELGFGWAC